MLSRVEHEKSFITLGPGTSGAMLLVAASRTKVLGLVMKVFATLALFSRSLNEIKTRKISQTVQ